MVIVRPATAAEGAAAAELLAEAFAEDPLVVAATAGSPDRADARRALFETTVASGRAQGVVLLAVDDGIPTGVAVIADPPRSALHGLVRRLRDGNRYLRIAPRVGAAGLGLLNDADGLGRRLGPRHPHHTLVALGVAAHGRRRGVGRMLVDAAVARASSSAGLRLETESADNASRYARWGFQLRATAELPGVPLYAMFRPTRG